MDMLLSDQTLFKNEDVFSPGHIPEEVLYRDMNIKELVLSVKPAFRGGKTQNCLITGPPATGKTTCSRIVSKEVGLWNKACVSYINCQIYDTPFKVFSEIHKSIFKFSPPETGVPLNAVYDKIFSHISKEKKTLLVILDETDRLFFGHANDVFYKILRAYETHPDARTCLWAISIKDNMHRLDDKVRSVFIPNIVKFNKYNFAEMKAILRSRCDEGLYKGVVQEDVLDMICENSADLRQAIETLRQAVVRAESHAQKKVSIIHLKTTAPLSIMSQDESSITSLIKSKPLDSGNLFSKMRGISYSKFYRILKKMESSEIIKITPVSKGKGKTSIISLKKSD